MDYHWRCVQGGGVLLTAWANKSVIGRLLVQDRENSHMSVGREKDNFPMGINTISLLPSSSSSS